MFSEKSHFTDDTVMTIAVADAFLSLQQEGHGAKSKLIASLKEYGRKFPNAGYGTGFARWVFLGGKEPYNSWGNGSAMRVSGAAWLHEDIEAVRAAARLSAEVTHNHPEGIKGAEATAAAIFLARTVAAKQRSRLISRKISVITLAAPAMRSVWVIVMLRVVMKPSRRRSQPFWKANPLKM